MSRRALLGTAALGFSALYLLSDVIEAAQGGFSDGQLWLTLVAEAAIPLFVIGLYRVQSARMGRLGRLGAAAYAAVYALFTASVVYALVDGTPDFAALSHDLRSVDGPRRRGHGARRAGVRLGRGPGRRPAALDGCRADGRRRARRRRDGLPEAASGDGGRGPRPSASRAWARRCWSVDRVARRMRLRRSCLAVPGSSERMMAKAASSRADLVFLDLEDACAPNQKPEARQKIVEALTSHDFAGKVRAVRINGVGTEWAYRDIVEVVGGAGAHLDVLVVPKVEDPREVVFVAGLLDALEREIGAPRRIGLELQIESPRGAVELAGIAQASERAETLVFGPGDYAAAMQTGQAEIGMVDPR